MKSLYTIPVAIALCISVFLFYNKTNEFDNCDCKCKSKTLLFFHASWCKTCKEMQPTIDAMKKSGYNVYEVDFDKEKSIINRYNVQRIPTTIIIDNNDKEVNRHEGAIGKDILEKEMNSCDNGFTDDARFFNRFRDRFRNRNGGDNERQNHESLPKVDWNQYPQVVLINNQEDGKTTSMVSGVIIDKNDEYGMSIVISCAHGYTEGSTEQVVTYDGKKHTSQIVALSVELDTMILLIQESKINPLEIKTEPSNVGDTVSMLGFADGSILVRVDGTITEFSSDGNVISTTCDVWHGCSGGPIVDSAGRVISTVTAGENHGGYTLKNCIGPYLFNTLPQIQLK